MTVGEAGVTGAGRVTRAVFRKFGPTFLKGAEVGGSYAQGNVSDEGLSSQWSPWTNRRDAVHVFRTDVRERPAQALSGLTSTGCSGHLVLERNTCSPPTPATSRGLATRDLSNIRSKAWYVQGTWVVTGETKDRPLEPRKGGLGRGGSARWSSRSRFDKLRCDSEKGQDPPFRNTRAETVFPNSDSVFTVGFTYRANRWVKIQVNAIHESISDPERAPTAADSDTPITKCWNAVVRFQFEI